MAHSSWQRHIVLAALAAAPLLTLGGPALAQRGPAAGNAPSDSQRATTLFVKGVELFKGKRYPEALDAFKQSYALLPSPNSHLYIARCLAKIGQTRAAYLEFDKVYDEASARAATEDKYIPTRDSARTERDELTSSVALVTVNVQGAPPGTRVRVGVYDVPPDRLGKPYPVEPGTVEVQVLAPGQSAPTRQTVSVGPGQRTSVSMNTVSLPPEREPPPVVRKSSSMSGVRIGSFVAAGIGVAGFAMFAAGGLLSKSTYALLDDMCHHQQGCPSPTDGRAAADDKISTGKTQQLIANIGLGIGIAGIATGATLFVISTRSKKSDDARPSADLVFGPSWAGVRGSF